jgi:hypothetical protein
MKNITSIILIIVSIGIFFFYIDREYKEVKTLQDEISANDEILKVADRLRQRKEELGTKFNQISQDEKVQLEKLLPDTLDNIRLMIDIKNIAAEKGIVVRDVSINTTESKAGDSKKVVSQKSKFEGILEENSIKYVDTSKIGVISFSFSVSAKYEVFLDFLKKLEESLRLVDIRNIEITRGSGESVFYDYRVTFDTYWLK